MKRIVKSGVMLLFGLLAFSGLQVNTARADAGGHKNYGRVGLGFNQFSDDLDDAGYDEGIAANVTYGRYLGKYIAIEGTLGSFYTDQDFSGNTGVAGSYTREDEILVNALLVTLKGEIPIGPVTLYSGAGMGVYYADFHAEIDTRNLGGFDVDDDDTVFGVHLVAGVNYDITERLFIGAEGLYRWTGDLDINRIPATVPVQLEGDLDGLAVTLSVGYRF